MSTADNSTNNSGDNSVDSSAAAAAEEVKKGLKEKVSLIKQMFFQDGRFEFVNQVGRGSAGSVYQVQYTEANKQPTYFVLKLGLGLEDEDALRTEFERIEVYTIPKATMN